MSVTFIKGVPQVDPSEFGKERVVRFASGLAQGVRVTDILPDSFDTAVDDITPYLTRAMLMLDGATPGGLIWLDRGVWRQKTAFHVKRGIHLSGECPGWAGACRLAPDLGVTSVIVDRYNTPSSSFAPAGGVGDGAVVSNLLIQPSAKAAAWAAGTGYIVGDVRKVGTGAGEDSYRIYVCSQTGTSAGAGSGPVGYTTGIVDGSCKWDYIGGAHGVQLRARALLQNVASFQTTGNGFHIECQSPDLPGALTNANGWQMIGCSAYFNAHGIFCNGSDANAGVVVGLDVGGAEYFGVYDSSFLGNHWEGVQVALSGVGKGALGGGYFNDSIGGGSTFVGCYVEAGDGTPPSNMGNGSTVIGGALSSSAFTAASNPTIIGPASVGCYGVNHIAMSDALINTAPSYGIGRVSMGSKGGGASNYLIEARSAYDADISGYGQLLRYIPYDGGRPSWGYDWYSWSYGPFTNKTSMLQASGRAMLSAWPALVAPGSAMFRSFYLGDCQLIPVVVTADPTSGSYQRGDRLIYQGAAVVAGGAEGKICTVAGTAGTYTGGRTGTVTGGSTVALSGAAMTGELFSRELRVGDTVVIASTRALIQSMSSDGLTLTLATAVPNGPGQAISFGAPAWKTFGSIAA